MTYCGGSCQSTCDFHPWYSSSCILPGTAQSSCPSHIRAPSQRCANGCMSARLRKESGVRICRRISCICKACILDSYHIRHRWPTADNLNLHRHTWPKLSQVQLRRLKTKERTPNIFLENLLTMNKLLEVLILLTTNKFSINFNKKSALHFLQYPPQVY